MSVEAALDPLRAWQVSVEVAWGRYMRELIGTAQNGADVRETCLVRGENPNRKGQVNSQCKSSAAQGLALGMNHAGMFNDDGTFYIYLPVLSTNPQLMSQSGR